MSTEQEPLHSDNDGSDDEYKVVAENFGIPKKSELRQRLEQTNKHKIQMAFNDTIFVLILPVILMSLAVTTNLSSPKIIGYAVLAHILFWMIQLFTMLCRAKNIYRINTLTAIPNDWVPMAISTVNAMHKNQQIESISEFSAIAGGVAKTLLAKFSTALWSTITLFCVFEIKSKGNDIEVHLMLIVIGSFGMVILGNFYLDPFSKCMKIGHYIGGIMGICILVGFFMQRSQCDEYVWIAITLFCIWIPFIILFYFNPCPSKNLKKASLFTMTCEAIALGTYGIGLCLYFVMYDCLNFVG